MALKKDEKPFGALSEKGRKHYAELVWTGVWGLQGVAETGRGAEHLLVHQR